MPLCVYYKPKACITWSKFIAGLDNGQTRKKRANNTFVLFTIRAHLMSSLVTMQQVQCNAKHTHTHTHTHTQNCLIALVKNTIIVSLCLAKKHTQWAHTLLSKKHWKIPSLHLPGKKTHTQCSLLKNYKESSLQSCHLSTSLCCNLSLKLPQALVQEQEAQNAHTSPTQCQTSLSLI